MAGAGDKIFKIIAAFDEQTFRAGENMLQALERQGARAAEAVSRVVGTLGGGPMSTGRTPGGQAAPGGFAQTQAAAGGPLSKGVENLGAMWAKASDAAQQGARKLVDHVREAAQGGDQHLQRLIAGFEKLTAAAQKASAAQKETGGEVSQLAITGPVQGPAQFLRGAGASRDPGALTSRLLEREAMSEAIEDHRVNRKAGERALMAAVGQGPPGQPPGGRGAGAGGGEGGGGNLFTMLAGNTALGGFLQRAAGYGAVGGALYAGYKAYDVGSRMIGESDLVNDQYKLDKEWLDINRKAAAGRTFGSSAVRLMQGDLGLARAISLANEDPAGQRLLSREATETRLRLAGSAAKLPTYTDLEGKEKYTSTGLTVENISNVVKQGIQKGVNDTWKGNDMQSIASMGAGLNFGLSPGAGMGPKFKSMQTIADQAAQPTDEIYTPGYIAMTKARAQIPVTQMEDWQKRVQMYRESAPVFDYVSSKLMGETFSRASFARTAGLSDAPVYDKKTGEFKGYSAGLFRARMEAQNISGEEGAAMMAATARTAGRGGMTTLPLSAQMGGLFNAAELYGAGAQMGQPKAFFNAVQGGIGRGGLDVTAGAELAGTVSQMGLAGPAMAGADKAFELIAGAAYRPDQTPGESLRAARMAQSGIQETGKLMGGGVDPLGQALTRRAALIGAKGKGVYAADALERLLANPVQIAQALKDNKLGEGMEGLGLSVQDLKTSLREQNLQNAVRTIRRGLPEGEGGAFARSLISHGGDLAETVRARVTSAPGGLTDEQYKRMEALRKKDTLTAKERKEAEGYERTYAQITSRDLKTYAQIRASDVGGNPDEQYEALEQQVALSQTAATGASRRARGAGAHDPLSAKAPTRVTAGATSRLTGETDKAIEANMGGDHGIKATAQSLDLLAASLSKMSDAMQGGGKQAPFDLTGAQVRLGKALDLVTDALQRATNRIDALRIGH